MDVPVNLAVSDNADFARVLARARDAGLRVTQSLDGLGVISGTIERTRVPMLARIPGVSVEEDREVRSQMP
jgi:hypothetical protein